MNSDADRKIQKIILEHLNQLCPDKADVTEQSTSNSTGILSGLQAKGEEEGLSCVTQKFINRNVYYLKGHGLVDYPDDSKCSYIYNLRITAKGIDFLADDGGLSAILGVVTVKLHGDTIQALLAAKIDEADIPPEEKGRLKTELGKI